MKKKGFNYSISKHYTGIGFFVLLTAAMLLVSCSKDKEPEPVPRYYLLSFEKINNYSDSFVKLMLGAMNDEYPGIDTLRHNVNFPIDLYSITYKTHYKGSTVTASGLVCVPVTTDTVPILSFQNGTNTYKMNAPTKDPGDPLYLLMEMMASHGYIVVIADYLGFGVDGSRLHPYYDKASTTDAVSDMIMAAHELVKDESITAKFNGQHFLMGYSQGGWATLAELQKAEGTYAGSIPVVAASCGAGAYDLNAMSDYVLSQSVYPGPLYLPYFIYSKIVANEINQPLSVFFKEPYASLIPGLFSGNYTNTEVNSLLTDTIASLVTDSLQQYLNTADGFMTLRESMSTNSVQAWNTISLLRFYHGSADINVPASQSDLIYNQFLSLGLGDPQVTFITLPDKTHDTGLIPWGISTVQWFDSLKE